MLLYSRLLLRGNLDAFLQILMIPLGYEPNPIAMGYTDSTGRTGLISFPYRVSNRVFVPYLMRNFILSAGVSPELNLMPKLRAALTWSLNEPEWRISGMCVAFVRPAFGGVLIRCGFSLYLEMTILGSVCTGTEARSCSVL